MRWLTTVEDWKRWRGEFALLPVVAACPAPALPLSWLPWWTATSCSALLETGKAGRYTILAPQLDPLLLASEATTDVLRFANGAAQCVDRLPGSPLEVLRNYTGRFRSPNLPEGPPFCAGLLGFLSYDLARLLEKLPVRAERDMDLPLAAWGVARQLYVVDQQEGILYCTTCHEISADMNDADLARLLASAQEEVEMMHRNWIERAGADVPDTPADVPLFRSPDMFHPGQPRFSLSREEFVAAVLRAQELIRNGETYQVNLSVRETRPLQVSPELIYEELRRINPSPYMALLRLPHLTLVSGSPELLVRLRDGKIEARPIAGTRPRGCDCAEDQTLALELIENSKERAEHLMLVDLIRNDVGRVSAFGTVRVSEFMAVEKYSHVMHIVSHIESRPAPGKDLFDIIAATFPGGTITGAPKIRTMETIEELEPVRRGPYTGSIGWIGFNGEMELNITIRTLVALDGEAHVQGGAGIVIDSHPEHEYEEALSKARALWTAAEAAEARAAPAVR